MANKNKTAKVSATKKTTSKPSATKTTNTKNTPVSNNKPAIQQTSAIKTARVLMIISLLSGTGFVGCFILNATKIITIPWFVALILLIFALGLFILSLFIVGNDLAERGELNVKQIKSEETKKTLEKLNSNPTFAKYSKLAEQQTIAKNTKK